MPTSPRLVLTTALLLAACPLGLAAEEPRHEQAVRWLLSQQLDNGGFGEIPGRVKGQLGITAIVVRALAEAPAALQAEVAPALERAVPFLLACQQDDGAFVQGRGIDTYHTAVCVLALAAVDAEHHAAAIEKAAAWLKTSQLDAAEGFPAEHVCHGGFSYGPAPAAGAGGGRGRGGRGGGRPVGADLSNTHMALSALHIAGVPSDDAVFQQARVFLNRCQNAPQVNDGAGFRPDADGGFVYNPVPRESADRPAPASYAGMTYSGLYGLQVTGAADEDPAVQAGLRWAVAHYTLAKNAGLGGGDEGGRSDQAGLYYYYYTFSECLALRGHAILRHGDAEHAWAQDLLAALAERQRDDGSFVNTDRTWWENDPVLATGFAVQAMNRAQPYRAH